MWSYDHYYLGDLNPGNENHLVGKLILLPSCMLLKMSDVNWVFCHGTRYQTTRANENQLSLSSHQSICAIQSDRITSDIFHRTTWERKQQTISFFARSTSCTPRSTSLIWTIPKKTLLLERNTKLVFSTNPVYYLFALLILRKSWAVVFFAGFINLTKPRWSNGVATTVQFHLIFQDRYQSKCGLTPLEDLFESVKSHLLSKIPSIKF